ncbi:MAG: energy transducer TonB [Bacteroidetes bacterium]|nr:energy transducer TonB [Bacteroidota bacterium]
MLSAKVFGGPAAAGDGDGYLAFAEKMPSPVGGLTEVYKKLEYPRMAQQAGVQGKVYVLAFINEKGGVDDVKVLKGIGAGCDDAVIAAIKKSEFEPGSHEGQAVKVKLSLSFVFKIQ